MQNQENQVKIFDRHSQMEGDTRHEILDLITKVGYANLPDSVKKSSLKNYLFGLFDGYFYEGRLTEVVAELEKSGMVELAESIEKVLNLVKRYQFEKEISLTNTKNLNQ